jgi:hypothetical protein
MRPLSNIDIANYYKRNPKFGGVFSKDELHRQESLLRFNDRRVWILNMEDSNAGQGSHWVVLSFLNPDYGIYFDSYAIHPPKSILDFMKRHRDKNVMNEGAIQSLKSTACGWYTIYIIDMLLKGRKYLDILEDFTDDSTKNEDVLYNYFKNSKKLRP